MERLAEMTFWVCLATVAYVYLGYPLSLLLLPPRKRRKAGPRGASVRFVTVVIAAHNESSVIGETVRNKLEQDYPADRLDILVVSDGSNDGTDDVVLGLGDARVTLLRQEPRQGKTIALNRAVKVARGEVIVFSDANSLYQKDAVAELVSALDDPTVGYVTGHLIYQDPGETAVGAGSGMYMQYENWLRRLESRLGSIVGVNGGVDAIRRELYRPMRADQLPDFVLPLQVVSQGSRVVYCDRAVSREAALGRGDEEYRMRVRVSLRALHALNDMRSLFAPRYGLFGFQLLVHKVLRYLVVIPLALAFAANVALVGHSVYAFVLGIQAVCYFLAVVGWLSRGSIRFPAVFVPFYFCLLNVAAGDAFLRFLRGERQVTWTPRRGA